MVRKTFSLFIDDTAQHDVQESDDDEFDEGGPPEPEADQPMVESQQG